MDIKGVYPIIAPPFTREGEIDWTDFRSLIRHLVATKINGLTIFGIASEFYKFTDFERQKLAQIFLQELKGTGVQSVLSVTDHSTEVAMKRAKEYENAGADSLMLLPPFFLAPSIESLKEHIKRVLEAVSIPVFIQYAPTETKVEIDVSELIEMYDSYPNAVFKIESNPPMECIHEILNKRSNATIMNGYAGLYMINVLNVGGKGVMPGCSFSELYVQIYNLYQDGEVERAEKLHKKLLKYVTTWMSHPEYIIQIEKTILQLRGIIKTDYCRKPSFSINKKDIQRVQQFLKEFDDFL